MRGAGIVCYMFCLECGMRDAVVVCYRFCPECGVRGASLCYRFSKEPKSFPRIWLRIFTSGLNSACVNYSNIELEWLK